MVHCIHEHLALMERLSIEFQDKLLLATESPVRTRQELEQDITILHRHRVMFNNETLVWMQFQLALLSEQQDLGNAAAALFKSISSIIIRHGITPWWTPRSGFVMVDVGWIDIESQTPEEHEQKRLNLVEEQRRLIKEHQGARRNDLRFLKMQFALAELCCEGDLSNEEANSIYKHICIVAFTIGVTDPRGQGEEDVPQSRLEDMSWFPKRRFGKTLFIL